MKKITLGLIIFIYITGANASTLTCTENRVNGVVKTVKTTLPHDHPFIYMEDDDFGIVRVGGLDKVEPDGAVTIYIESSSSTKYPNGRYTSAQAKLYPTGFLELGSAYKCILMAD